MRNKILALFLTAAPFTLLNGATFNSSASGNWGVTTVWTVTGVDGDGIPDSDDDVIINAGHTITNNLVNQNAKSITINPSGNFNLNSKKTHIYGNFTKNGTLSGSGNFFFHSPGVISANSTITNGGDWYFYSNVSIAAGTVISKINFFILQTGSTLTNNGIVTLGSGSLSLTGNFIAGNNSFMSVGAPVTGAGSLNASVATNTFVYNGTASNIVRTSNSTYNNLRLSGPTAHFKTVSSGTLNITGNLIIAANVTVDCNSANININGNWTNQANTNCINMGITSFNGSGTQTITRTGTERFNNVELNGTGTVLLATPINCLGYIMINSGTLDVSASNYAISLQGNFVDSGIFNARAGTVTFNGTAAQTIDGMTTTTFYNITSTNTAGVSINFTKRISNLLTVSAGSFGPSAFGQFELLATGPTTYARIAPVGGTLTGAGWVVQAYVNGPATAYWQYCSTPINGNILNDWDNDTRFFCSGTGGNDGNACCPVFYSVRFYNTSTNTYTNVTTINHSLVRGRGYMVWMADNLNSLTAPLIYDSRGTPNFGNVTKSITAGGSGAGYNLVGNPYACPINYSAVQSASGNIGGSFLILQDNGTYTTNPNSGVIAPNQGFMCVASASGNMTFTEACKNTTALPNIIRQGERPNYVRVNVSNDQNGLGGETAIELNNEAHNGYDINFDMPFLASPYEMASNIWSTDAENKDNILNALDATGESLEIPITVLPAVPGNQIISVRGIKSVSMYNCAWLEDTETGERINLNDKDTYTYYAETGGQSRKFILHFDRSGSNCPLSDLNIESSVDALSQVYTNGENILAQFFFTEKTDVTVSMFDVEGREVMAAQNFTVSGETISLGNPGAHGVYFVRIQKGENVTTKKIYY